ncbi:hypothetical protein C2G38_2144769 [Gigaspora rosea]|uniref:RRM domain-containing protein n=1 Tax=Gigaspora rosea TaxID=44941 RepID=A0A397US30_9GLOM|nr:hypothetical protein C2G38_2144769 [Gigaspora rosea]
MSWIMQHIQTPPHSLLSQPKLYIELHPSISDDELKKIVQDMNSWRSDEIFFFCCFRNGRNRRFEINCQQGSNRPVYGTFFFSSIEDAEKAFAIHKNKKLGQLYIIDPTIPGNEPQSEALILRVKNLPLNFTNSILFDIFRPFGPVFCVKLSYKDNRFKGYGFVQFFKQKDADKALISMGQQSSSSGNYNSQHSLTSPGSEGPITGHCDLFIKNLDDNISSNDVFNYFRRFGRIISARVMRDQETNNSKGFGFVSYTSAEEADRAKLFMDGKTLGSKQIIVRFHEPKKLREAKLSNQFNSNSSTTSISESRMPSINDFRQEDLSLSRNYSIQQSFTSPSPKDPIVNPCNLFIKNIDNHISSSDLFNHFRPFGRVISARIMRDQETNHSKGFGFVAYTSAEEADRAKSSMHGKTLGSKQIIVRIHVPKKLREAKLANQFNGNSTSSANRFGQEIFTLPGNYGNQQSFAYASPEDPIMGSYKLLIKNLDNNIYSSDLFNHFRRFGSITCARVIRDPTTNNSKGFGYVSYTSAEDADRAKSSMHGKILGTKQIVVRLCVPQKNHETELNELENKKFNGSPNSSSENYTLPRHNSGYFIISNTD